MSTYLDVEARPLPDVHVAAVVEFERRFPGRVLCGESEGPAACWWIQVHPELGHAFRVAFFTDGLTVATDAVGAELVVVDEVLVGLWGERAGRVIAFQGDGSFARRVRGGQSVQELEASWVEIDAGDLGVRDPLAGREG